MWHMFFSVVNITCKQKCHMPKKGTKKQYKHPTSQYTIAIPKQKKTERT